jgi:uncharacterized protein (TIGR03435 family)
MQIVALSLLLGLTASAQTFEVISVKPFKGGPPGFQGIQPGCKNGHFAAVTPVFLTMEWAYDMPPGQATEFQEKMPLWAQSISGSYELQATTQPGVTEDQCRKMTQHLFEDRFHFKYHLENITAKMYEMVLARGGLKMPPADDSPGWNVTINGRETQFLPGTPVRKGITMDELANWITGTNPDRTPVINKTGLEGTYKFKLAFSRGAGANLDFADPDVITAIQQQLGLKLQESRGPVQHLIVESIEKPDEN